jgi:hypothetical protein
MSVHEGVGVFTALSLSLGLGSNICRTRTPNATLELGLIGKPPFSRLILLARAAGLALAGTATGLVSRIANEPHTTRRRGQAKGGQSDENSSQEWLYRVWCKV